VRALELPPCGGVHIGALHFGSGAHTGLPHLAGAHPATKGSEGAYPATNSGGGADLSTTNDESSRLGDSKPPPPSRADLAIASQISGDGFGVGGSVLMCSLTIKRSLIRPMD
jgi:hypothetical protein